MCETCDARKVSFPVRGCEFARPQRDGAHLGGVLSKGLSAALELGDGLVSTVSTSPVSPGGSVLLLVVDLDGGNELGKLGLVLGLDLTERELW